MAVTEADWKGLQSAIAGSLILPHSPEYESVRKPAMARFENVRPAAVVLCATPADVSETIRFAAQAGFPTAIRSGGHSVAGHSSTHGMVIDVTPMRSVSVADGLATVGAGVRLGALYEALEPHGLTIPAGCGPSVGIAGLTLGGGIGILGRRYGLTCDHLIQAEVVLADGRIVECDEHHDGELFWALRGAGGGNFGVVTSFVFRTLPAPAATVFQLAWPVAHAAAVAQAWQAWAPTGPDELDATLRLTAAGEGRRPPLVELVGVLQDGERDAADLLDELVAGAGADPTSASHRNMPFREAKSHLAELGSVEDRHEQAPPEQPLQEGHLFTKSEFFRRPLPADAIRSLVENLVRGLGPGHSREVTFMPWGGAYNRVPADATAFVHREELFVIQHLLLIDPEASASENRAAGDWLARSWALAHPWGSGGVYPNFPDPDLDGWAEAYYGKNYERLVRIKARYDPGNFLRFRQSLPIRSSEPRSRRASPGRVASTD
jgi:FAD/FMN-containing dehydrogenase